MGASWQLTPPPVACAGSWQRASARHRSSPVAGRGRRDACQPEKELPEAGIAKQNMIHHGVLRGVGIPYGVHPSETAIKRAGSWRGLFRKPRPACAKSLAPLGLCPRPEGKDSVARGFLAADGRVGVVVRNYSDKPHAVRVSAEGCKHLGVYAPGETEPVGETKPVAADSVRFYLWCVKKT